MKSISPILLLAFVFVIISCKENKKKEIAIHPGWHKLSLPNGWIIYTPPDFVSKAGRGVDSEPGWIYSKKDSILLEYDSGAYEHNINSCDFQEHFQEAKASIDTGFYKTFYKVPFIHKAYIDTIDGKIAVIVTPTKVGKGTVEINIAGCHDGPWIEITGTKLIAEKEKLVLEIFKTIRLTKIN
jgi:hypothetical protein